VRARRLRWRDEYNVRAFAWEHLGLTLTELRDAWALGEFDTDQQRANRRKGAPLDDGAMTPVSRPVSATPPHLPIVHGVRSRRLGST
jgi:hypothetical protein